MWSESEIAIREKNLDFSFTFTKKQYVEMTVMAEEILREIEERKSVRISSIFQILAGRCLFDRRAIECVFSLMNRKSVTERNLLLVSFPIVDPLDSLNVNIVDFEFRLVKINQDGPL